MRSFLSLMLPLALAGCGADRFTTGDGSTSGGDGMTSGGDGSSGGGDAGREACAPPQIDALMDPPPGYCPTLMLPQSPYFCDDFGVPGEQLPRTMSKGWIEVVDHCSPRAGHRIVAGGGARGRVYEAWQNQAGTNDLAYLSHSVTPIPGGYVILPMQVFITGGNDGNQITRIASIRVETNAGPFEGSIWLAGNKLKVHVSGGPALDIAPSVPFNQWLTIQGKIHVNPGGVDMMASFSGNSATSVANPQPSFNTVNKVDVRIGVVGFEGASTTTNAIRFNDVYAWGQ